MRRRRMLRVGGCSDRLEATVLLVLLTAFACQSIIVVVAFDFTLPAMNASHCGALRFRGLWYIHGVVEKETWVE